MKYSYNAEPLTEKVKSLSEGIVDLLVSSGTTYKEANEAMEAAQDLLSRLKLVK